MKNKLVAMKSFWETLIYCLKLSWCSSAPFTCIRLIGKVIVPIIGITTSFIYKSMIDALITPYNTQVLYKVVGLIVFATTLSICNVAIEKIVAYAGELHKQLIQKHLALKMMKKAESVDVSFFDDSNCYDKFATAKQDSYAVIYILWNVLDCISGFLGFLGSTIALCTNNWLYAALMIISAFPSAIVGHKYTKSIHKLNLSQVKNERRKEYLFYVSTTKQYAQDVRLYQIGKLLRDRYTCIWNDLFSEQKSKVKERTFFTALLGLLPDLAIGFITLNIAIGVINLRNTLGDYTLYTKLLAQLWMAIFALTNSVINIHESKLKIDNVRLFDKLSNKIVDTGTCDLNYVSKIEFVDVGFTYPSNQEPSLSHVSFSINQGEKLCLIGLNGAGKTTLIKLLLRFYDVTEGEILINGKEISNYSIESLRRCFSCYFQTSLNYGFSIKENITLSDIIRSNEADAVFNAVHNGNAEGIIAHAPKGIESYLTKAFDNEGVELSGGENQKIALSRTFFRRCSAVILDEPSSSLDPESEEKIFDSLERFTKGKIALYTSHRLTNASMADKIIVLENGKIIEYGSKNELLDMGGRFAQLYGFQADKFK